MGAVQELERAFSAKSDATPGRIFLAAVRRRFADVITEGIDGSKEGSAAIRGGARSESGKEVPKIPALASAYDDSKSAIGKLGPEDLEGLFSDVLRWAYDAGSTFKPVEVLGFRTRLYEDASGLFTAAGEGNPRSRGACEKLAEGFAESGAVLKAVKGLRESGDVSDSQAAAAERSVPFWPANDARSGAEREEKRVGGSSGGARESALKALVSVGVPYRHIEKVWTELQEREPQRGDREGQSKFEEMGSPELAQSGGLTGQVKGGLAAVYRSALEEALTQGSGSALAGLKDGLELVLAGLAEKENGDDGSGLDGVRREVWAQVKAFTDDSGVPLRRKIQTLELLNSLEDRPGQGDKSRVWKGWRAPPGSAETKQGVAVPGSKDGGAHPPKTSLLLLKTAEIVQGEWPDREVDDVSTVSACEALFRTLVADVSGSATDSSTESGDVREDSAVAGGVFEARAGALFALLRLWEANSAAFGHETGGDVEQEKRGGGGGTAESQGGKSAEALAGAVEGSDGAKSAEGKEGTAISGDESSFAEEKGEAGKDEGRPTVREAEGERDAEKKGSESDGRTEAAAEEAVEDEGRKISRFHG